MKKLLLLLAFCSIFSLQAQIIPDAPWMQNFDTQNRESAYKFQDIVDAAEAYFETIDKDAKGSGYKPFKRWENYWQNYVGADGYLPTSLELWNSYLEVEARANTRNTQVDESNWISLGPTDFNNQSTSFANIGRVNVIIRDPGNFNTYYAGAPSGGIWKSTDAGLTWTILNDNLPQIGVSGIAIDKNDSNVIYIATGDDDAGDTFSVGVWKSIDGGATWNTTGLQPGSTPSRMNDIYIHPTNSNILWVATNSGIFKTSDGGVTWSNNLVNNNVRDIKINPANPDIVYIATSNRFYKSTDGGDSFFLSNSGLPTISGRFVIDVTPANPNYVYLVSANTDNSYQGVYRSTDSGDSWVQMANTQNIFESNQAWYDLALAVSDTDEDEIYVGVLNIWKSNNGGDSFTQVNQWNVRNQSYTHADIHFLRFYNGELFAGTDGGFFRSADGGVNFTDLTVGMEITQFYRIDVSEQTSNKVAGGTQDNGSFAYFNSWNQFLAVTADGMEAVIDPNNDNIYYSFMQFGQVLTVSNTSGQGTSQGYGAPDTANWITPFSVNSESEVYAGYSALWRFNTDVTNWTQISQDFGTNIDVLEIDPTEPDNMYFGINASLRKTTDRGVTSFISETFPSNITSIEVNNNDSNIVYVTTAGANGGIFRSLDGGFTFSDITGTFPNITKNVIKHRRDDLSNQLYVGTAFGVYRYDDNLGDWEEFDNNLPIVPVRDLAINIVDEKIVAGTYGRGVWISDMPAAEVPENDVRLISIVNPTFNSFNCGEIIPQILVKNNGQNDIVDIDVSYSVDGGSNNDFTWNGTLAPDAELTIDLPALNLPRGEHSLDVIIDVLNDAFPNNNNGNNTFYANDTGVAQLVNTFEAPEDELITFNEGTGVLWERGVPTGNDLNTAQSGTQVYGTNLDGNHTNNTRALLYSQCYDLSAINGPILKFHMAFEIEFDWDLAYVEYSTDQGNTWSLLGTADDPNWYNSSRIAGDGIANNCFNCVGGQWTGTNLTMQEYSYDLDALTNEPEVTFRMVFHSDQSVTFEGVIMDDFYVDGTLSTEEFSANDILIYPNPSNDIFNIQLKNAAEFNYSVTDITGKVIMREFNISQSNYSIDMSAFSTGMYFLRLDSNGRTLTKKLIKN